MAKVKKAQDELNAILMNLYLIGLNSEKDAEKIVVGFINDKHPCQVIVEMIARTRLAIDYLSN